MIFEKKTIIPNEKINETCRLYGISPLIAELILGRISDERLINKYLFGTINDFKSPFTFPDMSTVTNRLLYAFENNEKVTVYGDYDCDGIGAIAIFTLACRSHRIDITHYIPTRAKEGYGLNKDAISYIRKNYKTDLLVTVDCGINSIEEVEFAKSIGIDIIVTDHHQPGDVLPNCPILNPFTAKGATPLCGAGVVFTLISALWGINEALNYVDICAISTIADIVPLIDDNRLIVKYGMEKIKKGKTRLGIKELLYKAKLDYRALSTEDIGFKIAPRINAAGRLKNAEISLRLLLSEDYGELHMIADELDILNSKRQDMNSKIFEEAMNMLKNYDFSEHKIIMLQGNWMEGVVGIVCAKLAEYFNLPTVLVCIQNGGTILKGSARSIAGINLYELFDKNNELLLSYGGHEMAAGISFEERYFDTILNQFDEYIKENTPIEAFDKKYYYDTALNLSDITPDFLTELELLAPFGHQNPLPIFCDSASNAKFVRIGKTVHAKAKYKTGELVAFDKMKFINILEKNNYKFIYTIEKNYFNGKISNQYNLKELSFDSFIFDEVCYIENFCKSFLIKESNDLFLSDKNGSTPTLYVSYSKTSTEKILNELKNLSVIVYGRQKVEIRDTLVIAPEPNFNFDFFSRVIFLDSPGKALINRLKKSIKKIELGKNEPYKYPIDVEELRNLYLLFKKNLEYNKRYLSAEALYEEMYIQKNDDDKKRVKFIIGFYILVELGLINIGETGIITVENKKVDLKQSTLYNYINE